MMQKLRKLLIDSDMDSISSAELALAKVVEPAASLSLASELVVTVDQRKKSHDVSKISKSFSDLSYVSYGHDVFALGAGGNPQLSTDRRLLDANADRASVVLNALGDGLQLNRSINYDEPDAGKDFSEDALMSILMLLRLVTGDPVALSTSGRPLKSPHSSSWISYTTLKDLKAETNGTTGIKVIKSRHQCTLELD